MLTKEEINAINSGITLLDLKIHESWMIMKAGTKEENYEKCNKNFSSFLSALNEFTSKINFTGERGNRDKFTVTDVLILNDIESTVKKNSELQLSLLASIIKDTSSFDDIHKSIVNSTLYMQNIREYIKENMAE